MTFINVFLPFPVEDPIQDHCIAFSSHFFFFFKLEDNWFTVLFWWSSLMAHWVKNPPTMLETTQADMGLIPGWAKSPRGEHGNPLQYFLPVESHGQRSMAGYSPRGRKESDMTEATEHAHTLCWFLLPTV